MNKKRKKSRRIIAMILSICMLLGTCGIAYAEEPSENKDIIDNVLVEDQDKGNASEEQENANAGETETGTDISDESSNQKESLENIKINYGTEVDDIVQVDEFGNVTIVDGTQLGDGVVEVQESRARTIPTYIVNFRAKANGTPISTNQFVSYTEYKTGNSGYINGISGADAAYLGKENGKVKFMMSGVIGLVDEKAVQVVPVSDVQSYSDYYADGTNLIHRISSDMSTPGYGSRINVGLQPSYLTAGSTYYSYDGHYFYTDYDVMLEDYMEDTRENAVNAGNPYYNYFQYLPLRSATGYSAVELKQMINSRVTATSKLYDMGSVFVEKQNLYGTNALLVASIGAIESGWGTSEISQSKNNLFGWNAVDATPGESASYFASPSACIEEYTGLHLSQEYLNPGYSVYHGGFLGNKASGMNVSYASDPYWGEKIAGIAWSLDSNNGAKDLYQYTLGIKDNVTYNHTGLNIRKEAVQTSALLYKTVLNSHYSVIILGESNGFYKIQSDAVLNSTRTSVVSGSGNYNASNMYAYASKDYIGIVCNGKGGNSSSITGVVGGTTGGTTNGSTGNAPGGTGTSSTIKISGQSLPGALKVGGTFSVQGTITSDKALTNVSVGVYDTNGTMKTGKSVLVNTTSYNLKNLDAYIRFDTLAAGTYYYRITATNSAGTVTLVDQKFTVGTTGVTATPTIKISGQSVPDTMKVGDFFSVKGTVTSDKALTSVSVGVYDSQGTLKTGKTVLVNTTSYNLKNLDAYITFNTLSAGTYYYRIKATNSVGTVTLIDQKFTIASNQPTVSSEIKISGHSVPGALKSGAFFSVKGTVSSEKALTNVTVGVYDSNGAMKTGKSVAINTKSYNLSNLDAYIQFNSLANGTYYYRITATNSAGTVTLVNQKFTVGTVGTTTAKINISGQSIPGTLKVGATFSVKGTVTSDQALTSVLVGVYDSKGTLKTGKTALVNTKAYDLKNLDAYITFNTLPAGEYYYCIKATNASGTITLVNQKFNVTSNQTTTSSAIKISGQSVPVALKLGAFFSVTGTVTSEMALTNVSVGVYDANGALKTGKSVLVNTKSYNLKNLDAYITFNTLTNGIYYYRITATNSAGTVTLVNQKFTVGTVTTAATINVSGQSVPGVLYKGSFFNVTGTVTSNQTISSVLVGVYDANGTLKTGKSTLVNAKSYNLKNLDAYIRFDILAKGTYYYRIQATNASGAVTLVNQKFTVK